MSPSWLSDRALRVAMNPQFKQLEISPPPHDSCIQPASIDLHLGNEFKWIDVANTPFGEIDPQVPVLYTAHTVSKGDPQSLASIGAFKLGGKFVLDPGAFVLAHTVESVTLSRELMAVIDGMSSLARIGLSVHITAGYIDPGWSGQITLELKNEMKFPIVLTAGMKIAQLRVASLDMPSARVYGDPELGSKYVGESAHGAVGTEFWRNE